MASSKVAQRNTTATSRTTANGLRAGRGMATQPTSTSNTQGAIKGRPIERLFRPDTPANILERLDQAFGFWFVGPPEDDDWINPFKTPEWKSWEASQTPGSWLSGLREAHGWTQRELGERMGGVSPARISDWEHDRRSVSKAQAKILSQLFRVEPHRFF